MHHRLGAQADTRIVGEAASSGAAQELLGGVDYDVVFSEVHLPGASIFELAPWIRPEASLVLVTSSEAHAVRAYEIGALDYILKPATPERLALAMRRHANMKRVSAPESRPLSPDDSLPLRCGRATRFTSVNQISVITAQDNYSEVTLACGNRAFLRRTLKSWESALPPKLFVRVHRTQIVNLSRVTTCRRDQAARTFIELEGLRAPIVASRHRWRELRDRLKIGR